MDRGPLGPFPDPDVLDSLDERHRLAGGVGRRGECHRAQSPGKDVRFDAGEIDDLGQETAQGTHVQDPADRAQPFQPAQRELRHQPQSPARQLHGLEAVHRFRREPEPMTLQRADGVLE